MSDDERLWALVRDLRKRVAELEALEYKFDADNADTVDGYHAATSGADGHVLATGASGQAQIDGALTLLGRQVFSGANSGAIIAFIPRKQVTAGSATAVFSITTTNEAGDTDAGSYDVWVLAGAEHSGGNSAASNIASMSAQYMWTRGNKATGAGVTGTEAEIYQTASAATDAAARDITGIALTTTEVSEYVVNVEFNVGLSGSAVVNAYIDCLVILKWRTYTTPPVITAL